jgi:hypothetical protein
MINRGNLKKWYENHALLSLSPPQISYDITRDFIQDFTTRNQPLAAWNLARFNISLNNIFELEAILFSTLLIFS